MKRYAMTTRPPHWQRSHLPVCTHCRRRVLKVEARTVHAKYPEHIYHLGCALVVGVGDRGIETDPKKFGGHDYGKGPAVVIK